jgi:hypothetical protein
MERRIGLAIIAIALLHTLCALWIFSPPLMDILRSGLVNTVRAPPMSAPDPAEVGAVLLITRRAAAYWFVFAGLAFLLLGFAVRQLEKHAVPLPAGLGYWLLASALAGGAIWPVSGVWLLLIPAFGALGASRKRQAAA